MSLDSKLFLVFMLQFYNQLIIQNTESLRSRTKAQSLVLFKFGGNVRPSQGHVTFFIIRKATTQTGLVDEVCDVGMQSHTRLGVFNVKEESMNILICTFTLVQFHWSNIEN